MPGIGMFRALTPRRLVAAVLLVAGSMAAVSEAAHWIASKGPTDKNRGKNCAVLVLGSPANADGSATEEERLRVEAGIRGARENGCDLLVLSGGAVHNKYKEADVMAALVSNADTTRHLKIARETLATNTWDNIRRSLPLLDRHARILIASDALHAQRGRRYLCKQRPALCDGTGVTGARRPWWRIPYRLGSSLYELRAWIRDSLLF
jgi:vancomycin permeability regulator SanA